MRRLEVGHPKETVVEIEHVPFAGPNTRMASERLSYVSPFVSPKGIKGQKRSINGGFPRLFQLAVPRVKPAGSRLTSRRGPCLSL
jgi:hypothetical protein